MSIQYPHEARMRMGDYPPEELRDFTLELPNQKLQEILNRLPPLKGFRPGKDVPVRLLTYFGKLTRWTEEEWNLMGDIWLLWAETHNIDLHIFDIESSSDFEKHVKSMFSSGEIRRNTIMILVQAARNGILNRETILSWYNFGPFPLDTEVMGLIELAPTREENSFPKLITTLEQRALQLERNFQKISTDLKVSQLNFSSLEKKLTGISETFNSFEQCYIGRANQLEKSIEVINNKLDSHSKEKEIITSDLEQLKDQISNIKQELIEIRKKSITWKEICDQVEEIIDSGLRQELNEMQEKLYLVSKDLEHTNMQGQPGCDFQRGNNNIMLTKSTLSTNLDDSSNLIVLQGTKEIILHLQKNLNSLGIKLKHAQQLATEVLAALAAGQLVTFSGTLGIYVAERCAVSLAGENVDLIHIPVGLLDGLLFQQHLTDWLDKASKSTSTIAVVFEGINRSAIEVYGAALRQFIISQLLHMRTDFSVLIFATLEDGPAALPWGKGILELGPVFSTDALGWMDKSTEPSIPGRIPREIWLETACLSDEKYDWEELMLPDWLQHEGGALWRRTLLTAVLSYNKLNNFQDDQDFIPLNDTAFGWVLPMVLQACPDRLTELLKLMDLDDRLNSLLFYAAPGVINNEEY